MKLTNTLRGAFIRAAMQDVPNVDYGAKITAAALEDAVAQLPPKVRAIYNDKALRHFVKSDWCRVGPDRQHVPSGGDYIASESARAKVEELSALKNAQDERNSDLRNKLRGCAYACSTRKALLDMLPEFEKYMPSDEAAACRTLPVVANVVSDFVKAGWPKDAKKGKGA